MAEVTTVGVDLSKEVIVVGASDARGRTLYFKQLSFGAFGQWAANLPPCVFGMEACSSAHHWARFLAQHGHTPRLMAAEHVAPFRMSRGAKNDRNDAQAIAMAVVHPNMRFVTGKSLEQQAMLAWHRSRSGYVEERTALLNRIRGLLAEFGIWIGRSSGALVRHLPELMDDERLPELFRPILLHAQDHLRELKARIDECDARIADHALHNEDAQRAQQLCGIGPQIASALVATVSNPRDFRNGRQLAAWAGLVPKQFSTGGKSLLGPITKRGDAYLRGLLTQGARSAVQSALRRKPEKRSRLEQWIIELHGRVGYHKTLVAIANKYLRILWAILARKEDFDARAWLRHASNA